MSVETTNNTSPSQLSESRARSSVLRHGRHKSINVEWTIQQGPQVPPVPRFDEKEAEDTIIEAQEKFSTFNLESSTKASQLPPVTSRRRRGHETSRTLSEHQLQSLIYNANLSSVSPTLRCAINSSSTSATPTFSSSTLSFVPAESPILASSSSLPPVRVKSRRSTLLA